MRVHAKKHVDSGLVKSTRQVEFITTDIAGYSSQRGHMLLKQISYATIDCNWALYLYTPKKL